MGYGRFNKKNPFPLLSSVSNAAPVLNHATKRSDGDWEINSIEIGFSQHNVVCFRSLEYGP
jgi:hypothetical protein